MKKKILVGSFVVAVVLLAIVSVQSAKGQMPPPPPPEAGPPPPPSPPPIGWAQGGFQNRWEMWEKFKKEHPEDAKILMDMMEKYPELKVIIGIPGSGPRAGAGMGMGGGAPGRGMGSPRGGMRWAPGEQGDRIRMRDPAHHDLMVKIMSLRERAFELGEQYQNTSDAQEKKKIEAELRKVLAEIYDLRLAEMKMRVKHVEMRVAQVKEELSKYEKDKNGVIESWFKRVTGQETYKEF